MKKDKFRVKRRLLMSKKKKNKRKNKRFQLMQNYVAQHSFFFLCVCVFVFYLSFWKNVLQRNVEESSTRGPSTQPEGHLPQSVAAPVSSLSFVRRLQHTREEPRPSHHGRKTTRAHKQTGQQL